MKTLPARCRVAPCLVWMLWAVCGWAGPSLPVTKPPVQTPTILTGPVGDATAVHGQWFMDAQGIMTVRSNEFHDNFMGGYAGTWAISGHVDSVTYDTLTPGMPIVAFTIQATIVNDTGPAIEWLAGGNSHGESLSYTEPPYVGPLVDAKLTAEFAIADANALPPIFQPPYVDRQPYIEAVNEDQAAWYCWNPEDPDHQPHGGFFVPAWDFGTIPPGQAATRQLAFQIPAGLFHTDPRYGVIVHSFTTTNDVLLNRSTSLKISTWIDDLALDTGMPYPEQEPFRGSDVSVFHNIAQEQGEFLDFGDAPDSPYPTLLVNDGARHIIVPGVHLGQFIDAEPDGQPDPNALGDDLNILYGGHPHPPGDEDGVVFVAPPVIGQPAQVDVTVSTQGFLSAWVDFDANGSWADAGEQVFHLQSVTGGVNRLSFNVPPSAAVGTTFARFRFTTLQVSMSYTGLVANGEVEDYEVDLTAETVEDEMDFGDAGAPYPTLLVHNGARHTIVKGVHMGLFIDAEPDGQPTPSADGDDLNPPAGPDDEDGVVIPAPLVAGGSVQVQVVASVAGYLNAWIDWNCNGNWIDPGEQVFTNRPLSAGVNLLTLNVPMPPVLAPGGPHTRWRFTTNAPAAPAFTGWEPNGEVEDHEVHLEVLDFGDAPAPYPTLLANDGARHRVPSGYWLGAAPPDAEGDGQPHALALGDDLSGAADEDGVALPGTLIRGSNAVFNVVASTNGYLNAWMDFDGNGSWLGAGEQIASNVPLNQGMNVLGFAVPPGAGVGPTFARFRFGSATGLLPTGLALNGEVEDHLFYVYQAGPAADIIITNLYHSLTAGVAFVEWGGETAVTYRTEYTTNNLAATNVVWTPWGADVSSPPYRQQDTNLLDKARFYRVVAPWVP